MHMSIMTICSTNSDFLEFLNDLYLNPNKGRSGKILKHSPNGLDIQIGRFCLFGAWLMVSKLSESCLQP